MRRLTRFAIGAIGAASALAAACADPPDAARAEPRYLEDRAYRRAELEASLVNPANGYSQLRLARYATDDPRGWDALPEWSPPVAVIADTLDGAPHAEAAPAAIAISDAARAGDEEALRALGEEAFFRYPVQLASMAERAIVSRDAAARYGLWVDGARGAGGLVRASLADGSTSLAFTCATCHADTRGGALVPGVGNARLDVGRLAFDASHGNGSGALVSWGAGRVDVTTADGHEPVRIPDLRPVRWLTHLHHDATVAQRDRDVLAVRIETLIITSHGQTLRPPRAISLGLAAYVWSLAASVDSRAAATDDERRGAILFGDRCARCHAPPALTGPPVPMDEVGTDPALGLSADRGTGTYRVPSLHGVGTRGLLFHDASLPSLDALLDPARTREGFTGGTRAGAVQGHPFGLDLDADARRALVAYLQTL